MVASSHPDASTGGPEFSTRGRVGPAFEVAGVPTVSWSEAPSPSGASSGLGDAKIPGQNRAIRPRPIAIVFRTDLGPTPAAIEGSRGGARWAADRGRPGGSLRARAPGRVGRPEPLVKDEVHRNMLTIKVLSSDDDGGKRPGRARSRGASGGPEDACRARTNPIAGGPGGRGVGSGPEQAPGPSGVASHRAPKGAWPSAGPGAPGLVRGGPTPRGEGPWADPRSPRGKPARQGWTIRLKLVVWAEADRPIPGDDIHRDFHLAPGPPRLDRARGPAVGRLGDRRPAGQLRAVDPVVLRRGRPGDRRLQESLGRLRGRQLRLRRL